MYRKVTRRGLLKGGAGISLGLLAAPGIIRAQSSQPEEISIGALCALSGPAASFGASAKVAFGVAVDQINKNGGIFGGGKGRIKLDIVDDQSKPEVAVSEFARLARDPAVVAVLSVVPSASTMQASIEAERQKLAYINIAAGAKEVNERGLKYTFTTCSNTEDGLVAYFAQTKKLVEAAGKAPQKVAFVYENKYAGPAYARAWDGLYTKALNWGFGGHYPYDPTTSDFGPLVARLKADGIDFPIVFSYPQDAILLMRAMREQDYNPLAVSGLFGGFSNLEFAQVLKKDAEYVMGWAPFLHDLKVPGNHEFVEGFRAATGKLPDTIAGLSFNGLQGVFAALRSASDATDRESVHKSLTALDVSVGSQGIVIPNGIKFDAKGGNPNIVGGYFQVRDAVHRAVAPKEYATLDPVYPRPSWADIARG